jgi:DNA-binding LytR/AlgR family response regulator
MIKIVIVEDEAAAVERLSEMLLTIDYEIKIVHILDSVVDSIDYFSQHHDFDLIFMDIHLSDGNSFDIFKHVTISKPIIFTTAYSEYALDAFKQYAVDYLLKPIKKDQLTAAIKKYADIFQPTIPDYTQLIDKTTVEKRWMIKIGQNIRVVDYVDVAYYFTMEKITYLMTFEGKKYPVDLTLEQIETQITDENYFRINRQYIIHQHAIDKMSTHTKSRVRISLKPNEEEVIVSTERSPNFKKWLKG